MHDNAADVVALFQPHVRPVFPSIHRLIDTVPPGRRLTVRTFPGSNPDDASIFLVDCDVPHRMDFLVLEHRRETQPIIRRLPDPTRCRSEIVDPCIHLNDCDVDQSTTHVRWANLPGTQPIQMFWQQLC